jgi:ABC-type transporter Mla subunit MlaD
MSSGDTVDVLGQVVEHCSALLELFASHAGATERAMAASESLSGTVDQEVAGLRDRLQQLTTAATQTRTMLQESADGAVRALALVDEDARATGTAVGALVAVVEEGCTRAQSAADAQVQAVGRSLEEVDRAAADLSGALEGLSETLVEGRAECVTALNEVHRWLQEACDEHDRRQVEWRQAQSILLARTHYLSLYVSLTMRDAADAHAVALLSAINETLDDQNDVAAELRRVFVDDLESLVPLHEAIDKATEDLAELAGRRDAQLEGARPLVEEMEARRGELDAVGAALATTTQIGR